jgi:hypothetical protein
LLGIGDGSGHDIAQSLDRVPLLAVEGGDEIVDIAHGQGSDITGWEVTEGSDMPTAPPCNRPGQ